MTTGIVVVWEDGSLARRVIRTTRDLLPGAVVPEQTWVGIYEKDVEPYERGAVHPAFEMARATRDHVRELAPALKIDRSYIAFVLEVADGNPYRAETAAREKLAAAISAGATVVSVDREQSTVTFAEVFRMNMGAPPPFEIPGDAKVLSSTLLEGKRAELMIGTTVGQTLVVQADVGDVLTQPVGWFQAGFWGHGVNSYSVYYGRATERSRVFLRLAYGAGAYERDPKAAQASALATMKKYIELAATLPCKHVTLIQASSYAHWRLERLDGTVAEMQHDDNELFGSLDTEDFDAIALAPALPCGLELVWSASAPLHKLLRAPHVLGRETDAPDDERMSRKHLSIKPGTPHAYLEDLGSRNGTYIRGERLTRKGFPAGTIVRAARTVGVIVDDVDVPARQPHPAVATAKAIHDVARAHDTQIPIHASYVAWALEQTWRSRDELAATTRWALDELDVLDEKLLRVREWHPRGRSDRITRFATYFERRMGEPAPFEIPYEYWVYDEYDRAEGPIECLIGTRALAPMTLERDGIENRPVGWFMAGFWGEARNDTAAVYYGRVTARSRVYLRLRATSLEPSDRVNAPAKALATMKKYIALAETLPCKHVLLQQAYDACHWRIQRLDGSVVEMKQDKDTFPSYLDQYDLEAIARGE